jgi:hypothetical protein
MRPTPLQWLVASRYTLPLWLGLGLWLWYSQGGDWDNLNQDQQIAFAILGVVFAFAYIKSFPTVFFFEREQALYRKSSISPEERWRRQTVYQLFFLVLVAAALLYAGFHYWKSAPEPQPASYKAAAGVGGVSLLAGAAYVTIKPYLVKKQETAHTPYVSCPLPIPSRTPAEKLELPDYCQRLLTAGELRSPAQPADPKPEVTI